MQAFFHVLVRTTEDAFLRCVFSDLNRDQLKSKFLRPYFQGASILCVGAGVVDSRQIRQVHISKTPKSAQDELLDLRETSRQRIDEMNRNSPVVFITLGEGWSEDELHKVGVDVTEDYLEGRAPGSKSNRILAFISNNWITTIGAGLILALLIKWFGFN